jgi:hypothetical protein
MRIPPVDESAGVLDELQAWYLAKAEAEGWVYTSVLRQLVNRMYRERDYLEKRKAQGQRTAYDYAVDRDQKALAWAIRALVQHVPADEKTAPEPPKPARKPSRRLSASERALPRRAELERQAQARLGRDRDPATRARVRPRAGAAADRGSGGNQLWRR